MNDEIAQACQPLVEHVLAKFYPDQVNAFKLDATHLFGQIAENESLEKLLLEHATATGASEFEPLNLDPGVVFKMSVEGLKYVLLAWSTYKAVREIHEKWCAKAKQDPDTDTERWVTKLQEAGVMKREEAETIVKQFRKEFIETVNKALPKQ